MARLESDEEKELNKMIRSLESKIKHCKTPLEERTIRRQLGNLRTKLVVISKNKK
jgi:hypothetical protein